MYRYSKAFHAGHSQDHDNVSLLEGGKQAEGNSSGPVHTQKEVRVRRLASFRRARQSLALTVFSDTLNIFAVSSVVHSRITRKTNTVRSIGESSSMWVLNTCSFSMRASNCSGVRPLETIRAVARISSVFCSSTRAVAGRAAKLRRRMRAALITIRVSQVENWERPSNPFKPRKAESKPSCRASSASSWVPMTPSAE